MRTLASIGIFSEVKEGLYCHNRRSLAMKHPGFKTFISGLYVLFTVATLTLRSLTFP